MGESVRERSVRRARSDAGAGAVARRRFNQDVGRLVVVALFLMGAALAVLLFIRSDASALAPFNGPHVVPGVVEAEDFDDGGPAVSFSDTTTENIGGAYRDTAVDIWETVGAEGYTVGHTRDGEWLEYTVTSDGGRDYAFVARVASGLAEAGSLRLDIDGTTVSTTAIGSTGGWWNFADADLGSHALPAGDSVVRITWLATAGDLPKINLDSLIVSLADCGSGVRPAGDATIAGDRFRLVADIDGPVRLVVPRGSTNGPSSPGVDYVEFCATVPVAGEYRLDADVSTPTRDKNSFFVSVDGEEPFLFVADIATTPTTEEARRNVGRGFNFNQGVNREPRGTVAVSDPARSVVTWNLDAGSHLIRLYLHRDGVGLHDIEFVLATERRCIIDGRTVPSLLDQASCDAANDFLSIHSRTAQLRPIGNDPCTWTLAVTCNATADAIVGLTHPARLPAPCGEERPLPGSISVLGQLRELTIPSACVTSVPPEISLLTQLEILDLRWSELGTLPPEIGNLTQLRDLKLRRAGLETLLPEIGNLTQLETLDLSYNLLRGDITVLEPFGEVLSFYGNDCLSTTSAEFEAFLDANIVGWDRCRFPSEPTAPVAGYEYEFFESPAGDRNHIVVTDINDLGQVGGDYVRDMPTSAAFEYGGFIRDVDGGIRTSSTRIAFLSNRGDIAGNDQYDNDIEADLRLADGTRVRLSSLVNGTRGLSIAAMNNRGDIAVNEWGNGAQPFIRLADGTIIRLDGEGITSVWQINDNGDVAGSMRVDGVSQAFIRRADGSITSFDSPGSIRALNEDGVIAGSTPWDADRNSRGYVRSADGDITLFDVPGATTTTVRDMNDRGDIVGTYEDDDDVTRSYIRTADGRFTTIDGGTGGPYRVTAINNEGLAAGTVGAFGNLGFVVRPVAPTRSTFNGPHAAPGVVEAEDFDNGGQGVAFNDTTIDNIGGAYRTGAVDIWETSGAEGYTVGHTRDGEWLEYTISAENAMTVDVAARVASGQAVPGALRLEVNGSLASTTAIQSTNGWWNFADVGLGAVDLPPGDSIVRITWLATGADLPKINLDALVLVDVDDLAAVAVPGSVEAENYLRAVDSDAGNQGPATQFAGDVDVWPTVGEDGFTVGRTRGGEWLEYAIDVAEDGVYDIGVRLASGKIEPGTIAVSIDGDVVGLLAAIPRNGWWSFSTESAGTTDLTAGRHTLRLDIDGRGQVNVDRVEITENLNEPGCGPLAQPAFAGMFDGAVERAGTVVVSAPGTPNKYVFDGQDYVEFCVIAPAAGTYELDAVIKAPDDASNSFYVEVNGAEPFTWHTFSSVVTVSRTVASNNSPVSFGLNAGANVLRFYHRETGTEFVSFAFRSAD